MKRIIILSLLASSIYTSEVVHKFKSPSFSGISTSSHYLTIENQQKSRRDKIADDLESAIAAAERDAEGTTQAKFLRNLESRIYAQLSRQLVENLFGETPSDSGILELEGNTIEFEVVDGIITLRITDSDGNTTVISLPIGDFTF